MGEINYRKWANNWDPVVDVGKVRAKIDTNYQKALELTQRDSNERQNRPKSTRHRNKSAKPRETYFDQQRKEYNRRLPSKEDVHSRTYFATNRYKNLPDDTKDEMKKEWKHISNVDLLKSKLNDEKVILSKAQKIKNAKEYAEKIKQLNYEKTEEQRKAGLRPGLYTAKLAEQQEKIKSKENNIERVNRRKQREERNTPGTRIKDLFGNSLLFLTVFRDRQQQKADSTESQEDKRAERGLNVLDSTELVQ